MLHPIDLADDPRDHAAQEARDWLATAPKGLVNLIKRMTHHHKVRWDVPDYVEDQELNDGAGDGREPVEDLHRAEALGSEVSDPWRDALNRARPDDPLPARHALVLDLDVPAWLVPSSSADHGHLYVNIEVEPDDLWAFLEAAAKIGLVEEGYVSACKSRGMTSVRAPWIQKGHEPTTILVNRGVLTTPAADDPGPVF